MSINIINLDEENVNKIKTGIIVSQKQLIGCAVYEAIVCRNFAKIPVNIDYMIRDINYICDREFSHFTIDYSCKNFKNLKELENWIKDNLMCLDSFKQLNITEYEFINRVSYDDEQRISYPVKDENNYIEAKMNDFTDLDAYARNLAHDLFITNLDINYSSFNEITSIP